MLSQQAYPSSFAIGSPGRPIYPEEQTTQARCLSILSLLVERVQGYVGGQSSGWRCIRRADRQKGNGQSGTKKEALPSSTRKEREMGAREDEGRNEDTRRKRERKKDGGVGTSCSSTWGLLRVSRSVVLSVAFERFRTGCPSCLFDVSTAARSVEPSLDQNNRECDPFVAAVTCNHQTSSK